MRALLRELGDPQQRFPAIHVVGTNGKSTTTRLTEALLADAGLSVGAYLSPHVRGWSERIRVGGEEADFERGGRSACGPRRRRSARRSSRRSRRRRSLAFAAADVDVAVVEAGLGGRHDATNVLATRVVVLTNVALDHMDVLGDTREAIAAEKLAVVQPGCTVVLGEPEWQRARRGERRGRRRRHRAQQPRARDRGRRVVPRPAGRPARGRRTSRCPAGSSAAASDPLEIWDGAHNLAGIG